MRPLHENLVWLLHKLTSRNDGHCSEAHGAVVRTMSCVGKPLQPRWTTCFVGVVKSTVSMFRHQPARQKQGPHNSLRVCRYNIWAIHGVHAMGISGFNKVPYLKALWKFIGEPCLLLGTGRCGRGARCLSTNPRPMCH